MKLGRVTESRGNYWADCLDESTNKHSDFRNTLRMVINEEISAIANVVIGEIETKETKEREKRHWLTEFRQRIK